MPDGCPDNARCVSGECRCNPCHDPVLDGDGALSSCTARCLVGETCNAVGACECGHPLHDSLACHGAGDAHACPSGEHKHRHPLSDCFDDDHDCPPNASPTNHADHAAGTALCDCGEGFSDDPDQHRLQCVADDPVDESCGPDQVGTPPDCTDCGRHRVPNAAGTACGECADGEEEGFPGQCMPVGNCTRLGSYWPDAESGCVRAGLVAANAQCRSTCRAKSADNGWGICLCDPGHVYTVAAGAIFGPAKCVRRTDELCGAASDPGTCEPGTWNSGTARCDCGDGFERSDDGRSCVCATDDAEQTGYRASVLFPNPQSLFDGLRVGFVNTSSGNLTFRRRDIVTRAQGPAVFARVHDSRIAGNDDFGPGWRLSLAEELLVDGDAATYVDESGAHHAFAWTGTAWTASPPTPRHARTTLSFAEVDGVRTAMLVDGDEGRTFVQADAAGTRYVLRTIRTPARELVLDYAGGRLWAVSHEGTVLFAVERDSEGRIAEVRDDHGRSVRYGYDRDGRLETVRDIAGGEWRHAYGEDGRLAALSGPEGRTHLLAAYDDAGRAVQAFGDELLAYAYADGETTATDIETGAAHRLARNSSGVTTAFESATGVSWRVALDAANRVAELELPGRTHGYAYDAHGRLASTTTADEAAGITTAEHYVYDAQGRLTGATGAGRHVSVTYASNHVRIDDDAMSLSYDLDDHGRVTSVQQGTDMAVRAERDGAGDIVALSRGGAIVRFGRDELGRIAEAVFADGSSARYFYDELGNRSLSEHSDGSSVSYDYDGAGSMTSIEETLRDGRTRLWTATAAGVTRDASHDLPFELDRTDMTALRSGGERTGLGAESAATAGSVNHGLLLGTRMPAGDTSVLTGDHRGEPQPGYGGVASEPWIPRPERGHLAVAVPRLRHALALAEFTEAQFADDGSTGFDVPSNAAFRAAEAGFAARPFATLSLRRNEEAGDSACAPEQCAVPTGFRRTGRNATDKAVLTFFYSWLSSTGDLSDLADCTVREHVTYAGAPQGDFRWPPPFDMTVVNPTIVEKPASEGSLTDTHLYIISEDEPLQAASVSAEQYYQFSCPCHLNGSWSNLAGPYSIDRTVERNSNNGWKYTITKDGVRLVLDPLR